MLNQEYKLRYLPLFNEELESAVLYVAREKNNIDAAEDLLDSVEEAIIKRSKNNPETFETVPTKRKREHPYYRIYVGNYIIYYVAFTEGNDKIMEVRRFIHVLQNREDIK